MKTVVFCVVLGMMISFFGQLYGIPRDLLVSGAMFFGVIGFILIALSKRRK